MRALLLSLGIVLAVATTALAQAPMQIRKSDLSRTPIASGDLRITLRQASNGPFAGPGYVEIEVKNTGPDAASFDAQRLSFVRPDDVQIDVLGVLLGAEIHSSAHEILVVGGAKSKQTYRLNGKLDYPLRIFYQGKLIGEVIE